MVIVVAVIVVVTVIVVSLVVAEMIVVGVMVVLGVMVVRTLMVVPTKMIVLAVMIVVGGSDGRENIDGITDKDDNDRSCERTGVTKLLLTIAGRSKRLA